MNEGYNEALEWAANWITGAQMLGHSKEVIEFAQNMAMSLRAAKRPTPRALDVAIAPDNQQVLPADVLVDEGTLPEPPRQ